ncbi:MAG: DUF1553 domain-containing protein [Acidobacteria bacterium]|nr:DUF1553 domain-containing protein [Acidobacteriota bacterium]
MIMVSLAREALAFPLIAWLLIVAGMAADPTVDFAREIQPIFQERCLACHGSQAQSHGFRLDRRSDAFRGGDSGVPAIVPGNSSDSLLLRYVSGRDPEVVMPPEGPPLTGEQVELLRRWIDEGAAWPQEEDPSEAPAGVSDHWAFQPISRPEQPSVQAKNWVRNPIDAFVLEKLEAKGWQPAPQAKPHQLLRRLYLNLTGLPPNLAEQEAFLKDPSEAAYKATIEDLLARPAYGERWARHWLDLVRYAESNGYERDRAKPHVWKYRDYVIRSFNRDKPFDRFVLEQLAGDELPDASSETLIATGYFRLGPWDDEPADPETDRFDQLDDIVSTTSQVFLGLTLGCARCHNHKFDPLTARDYYSMVAVFNGLQRPRDYRTELDLPIGTPRQLEQYRATSRRIERLQEEHDRLRARLRRSFLESGRSNLPALAVQAFLAPDPSRKQKGLRKVFEKQLAEEVGNASVPDAVREQLEAGEREIRELKAARIELPRGYFMHEPAPSPPATHLLIRGSAANPGPEVAPAFPAILSDTIFRPEPRNRSSGRRLALARWLVEPQNPLTARVIVNRIWQKHFGFGLVRSASDFGTRGEKPTHPELLDWLARWFVREGWSFKDLHRLILSSNSYRMSRKWNPRYGEEDPENRLLWRMPRVRLEVEAIRDSMLSVSGRLNRRMYGPSMYPRISRAALEGHSDPDTVWKPSAEEEDRSRRTIYVFLKRSLVVPMLEVLDLCDTTKTAPRRMTTSVAPQALALFNGEFVNRQARYLAARLENEVGTDPERQIERAYTLALARPPSQAEKGNLLAFLRQETENQTRQKDIVSANGRRGALREMCRVILNLNEFVYPD